MILDLVKIGASLLDKVIPDPEARAKAKQELIRLQAENELRSVELQLSAIISESQSEDPWTSRARPTFLYVVYIVILSGIPMGVLYATAPETAQAVTTGFNNWLASIPEDMWWLFGAGYLGYTGFRSYDKRGKNGN